MTNFISALIVAMFVAIGAAVTFAVTYVAVATVFAIPTMLLWDWLMPTLFGLKTITLFQAWGINVLSGALFRGWWSGNKSK